MASPEPWGAPRGSPVRQVRRLPEVKAAAPVVESVLEWAPPTRDRCSSGIDPFSEKDFRDYEFDRAAA